MKPVEPAVVSACNESVRLFVPEFFQEINDGDLHAELVKEHRIVSPSDLVTAQVDGLVSITGMQSDGPNSYGERFSFNEVGIDVFVVRVDCASEKPSEPRLSCHGEPEKQGMRAAMARHADLFQTLVKVNQCSEKDYLKGVYRGNETLVLSHAVDGAWAESVFIARSGYEWFIRVNRVPNSGTAELKAVSDRVKALLGAFNGQVAVDAHLKSKP